MTRAKAIERVAKHVAHLDGYVWQMHPVGKQATKQIGYLREADKIIALVEESMIDWKWDEVKLPHQEQAI